MTENDSRQMHEHMEPIPDISQNSAKGQPVFAEVALETLGISTAGLLSQF